VLAPGEDTGWQKLPGAELTIVKSGDVVLQRSDACKAAPVEPGSTVVVPEGRPHLLRNTGSRPAELVVTRLLPAGSADPPRSHPPADFRTRCRGHQRPRCGKVVTGRGCS
jgi:quercetin dioxygenase-like cupin family protein